MEIKTKLAPGLTGFVLAALAAGIFEIRAVKITHVEADEDASDPEKIVNTTESGDKYSDNQIFETPEALARDLVSRYNAATQVSGKFTFGNNGASLPVGATDTATPVTPGGTFVSSVPDVATIDASSGLITAIAPGTTIISYSIANADPATVSPFTLSVVAAS